MSESDKSDASERSDKALSSDASPGYAGVDCPSGSYTDSEPDDPDSAFTRSVS